MVLLMKKALLIANDFNSNLKDEIINLNLSLSHLGINLSTVKDAPATDASLDGYDFIFVDQLAMNFKGLDFLVHLKANNKINFQTEVFLLVSKSLTKSERNLSNIHEITTLSKPVLPISFIKKFRGMNRV